MSDKELDDRLRVPCIVCGGPPVGIGIFSPTASWVSERGLPNKPIPYTVCEKHCDLHDTAALDVVEAAINRRFAAGRN